MEAYLMGTRDNRIEKKATTYWIFEVSRCDDSLRSRKKKDPNCDEENGDECEMVLEEDENGVPLDPECHPDPVKITEWL